MQFAKRNIQQYLDLQLLKKDGQYNITFEVEGIQIEPLFFIPYFENALTHGNLHALGSAWIKDIYPSLIITWFPN